MLFQYWYNYNCEVQQRRVLSYKNMKASFMIFPDSGCFSFMNKYNLNHKPFLCIYFSNGSIGFADHVERVLFTVCGWPSATTEDLFWPKKTPGRLSLVYLFLRFRIVYIYIYITTLRSSWFITTTVVKICHRHSPTYDPFNFSPLLFSVWRVLLIFLFIVNLFFLFLCFPFTLFFPLFFCPFFLSVRLMFVCHVFLCSFFFRYHFFSFFSVSFSFITPLPLSHIFFILNIFKKVMYF